MAPSAVATNVCPDRCSCPRARRARALSLEVRVDGELAGFTEYRRRPGLIAFTHTLIDPRFEGQGLASRLVQTALSEARSAGLAVLPFCPFVRGYIAGHGEQYLELVPGDLRDTFELAADVRQYAFDSYAQAISRQGRRGELRRRTLPTRGRMSSWTAGRL